MGTQGAESSLMLNTCSLSSAEVSAVLDGHTDWEAGVQTRLISWIAQGAHQLLPPGKCPIPVLSLDELRDRQKNDLCLSRVLFYINRGKRVTQLERSGETRKVLRVLKQ